MTDHPVTCLVANEGDAVAMLKRMHARAVHSANRGEVPRISSAEVLAVLRATQAERARHAEEVANRFCGALTSARYLPIPPSDERRG